MAANRKQPHAGKQPELWADSHVTACVSPAEICHIIQSVEIRYETGRESLTCFIMR